MREGYCSCLVCLSVCVSVTALAASASVYIRKQRYTRGSRRLFLDFDSWIFEKTFRSKVMARKASEQANMQISRLTSTASARSAYLAGTRSHNEGRVSTPACYLLLYLARVRLCASY